MATRVQKRPLTLKNRIRARGGRCGVDPRRACRVKRRNCIELATSCTKSRIRLESFSQDPIGFAAGDANLYRYVGNGPTNATDPNGLDEKKSGVLHSIDLALGQAVLWLFKRADDSYHGRGGGYEFIQDQVEHVGNTPRRFRENGEAIGKFPGQFQHRKLIAELADLKLQRIDSQIEDGTFTGDRTEARREIFEEGFAEIRETYRLQRDAVRASGELMLETALLAAPLAPKFGLRIAGQAGRSPLAPKGGFGVNGQIGSLPKGADSAVLRGLYLDQVNSTTFGVKLGIHNTIKKITTFGRSKWVTRVDVESVLKNKTQFRVGASTVHKVDDGFVIGGRESLGYFNRATSHHEMMHIGQYIRNPNIIDTRPIGYIHEMIPSYVGTPELYGGGTIIIGGVVYVINDALTD